MNDYVSHTLNRLNARTLQKFSITGVMSFYCDCYKEKILQKKEQGGILDMGDKTWVAGD